MTSATRPRSARFGPPGTPRRRYQDGYQRGTSDRAISWYLPQRVPRSPLTEGRSPEGPAMGARGPHSTSRRSAGIKGEIAHRAFRLMCSRPTSSCRSRRRTPPSTRWRCRRHASRPTWFRPCQSQVSCASEVPRGGATRPCIVCHPLQHPFGPRRLRRHSSHGPPACFLLRTTPPIDSGHDRQPRSPLSPLSGSAVHPTAGCPPTRPATPPAPSQPCLTTCGTRSVPAPLTSTRSARPATWARCQRRSLVRQCAIRYQVGTTTPW